MRENGAGKVLQCNNGCGMMGVGKINASGRPRRKKNK